MTAQFIGNRIFADADGSDYDLRTMPDTFIESVLAGDIDDAWTAGASAFLRRMLEREQRRRARLRTMTRLAYACAREVCVRDEQEQARRRPERG